MAARSHRSFERPPQGIGRPPASSWDPLRVAEVRREEAEAVRVELEAAKLADEVSRQPLKKQLLEVQIEEGRAEVDRRRSATEANNFATLRHQTLLIVFLLMVIFFLALAIVNPSMLEVLGGGAVLLGGLGLLGRR